MATITKPQLLSLPASRAVWCRSEHVMTTLSAGAGCRRSKASTPKPSAPDRAVFHPGATLNRRRRRTALDAAHAAKDAWGETPPAERARILNKIADAMESIWRCSPSRKVGQWQTGARNDNADLPLAIDHFRYFAGAIRAEEGRISEIDKNTVAYHFQEPLGVVGQIIPFNFPLLMAPGNLPRRWPPETARSSSPPAQLPGLS